MAVVGTGGDVGTGGAGGGEAGSSGGVAAMGAGGSVGGNTGGGGGAGTGGAGGEVMPPTTLRSVAAQTDRLIGAALSATRLAEPGYAAAATQFNYATPENEMKWDATEPTPNTFTFDRAEPVMAFAAQSWHAGQGTHAGLALAVAGLGGGTSRPHRAAQRDDQSHHAGGLALSRQASSPGTSSTKPSPTAVHRCAAPSSCSGSANGYIDDAFIAANAADPFARLYYNDYGAEGMGAKSNAVYDLVKGMLARGVPIHGVGLQMHTGATDLPATADIAANMQRLAALGLDVDDHRDGRPNMHRRPRSTKPEVSRHRRRLCGPTLLPGGHSVGSHRQVLLAERTNMRVSTSFAF